MLIGCARPPGSNQTAQRFGRSVFIFVCSLTPRNNICKTAVKDPLLFVKLLLGMQIKFVSVLISYTLFVTICYFTDLAQQGYFRSICSMKGIKTET